MLRSSFVKSQSAQSSLRLRPRPVDRLLRKSSRLLSYTTRASSQLSTPLAVSRPGTRPARFVPASQLTVRYSSTTSDKNAASEERATTSPSAKEPKKRGRLSRYLWNIFAFSGLFVLTTGGLVVAFFVYDASTYHTEAGCSEIEVPSLALYPRRGGPKNLPIADIYLSDSDNPDKAALQGKPRLVVLGSGWGSVSLLKTLNPGEYRVTLVSPNNYFLFTPLLPSAAVGTLGLRSLVEPIRVVVARALGNFLKAEAVDVDFDEKLVEVAQTGPKGESRHFYVPYDKLVVAVGCSTNPHGVKGLEYCNFLKSIEDARSIKRKINHNLELASLPTTSVEERKRLLSFVICGGGPTGIEFAAEVFEMLNEDLSRNFPQLLRNEISVHVIQSRSHVLNTYDEALSLYAEEHLAHDQVDLLTNSRVKEVQKDKIVFTQTIDGQTVEKEIPTGFCLWSTGVAQTSFTQKIAAKLASQKNIRALQTDSYLRLSGAPDAYAIGDCSTVMNNVADNVTQFLRDLAFEKGKDPRSLHLTFNEWCQVASKVQKRFPQASDHLRRLDVLFQEYDKDRSGTLDLEELQTLLHQIDSKLTSLPMTAQRANQQGQYLGRKFNKLAHTSKRTAIAFSRLDDENVYRAFKYQHLGSLAYIGNAAVFDVTRPGGKEQSFAGGLLAVYLWRSIYFAQSVSFRTRTMLAMDWANRALFGRDMMDF